MTNDSTFHPPESPPFPSSRVKIHQKEFHCDLEIDCDEVVNVETLDGKVYIDFQNGSTYILSGNIIGVCRVIEYNISQQIL